MRVLCAALCLLATAIAEDVKDGPALIEPFSRHLHGPQEAGFTYGGDERKRGELPYQVALLDRTSNELICSGAIISEEWVITAGHCVDQTRGDIDVCAGMVKLSDTMNMKRVTTSERTIHRNFNMDFLDNDIALIKLTTALAFDTKYINAVALPTYADTTGSLAGKDVTIAGWGTIKDGKQSHFDALKSAKIHLPENVICERHYGNVVIGTKTCAVVEPYPKSVCTGDSGTPVVVQQEYSTGNLVGIVSFGSVEGCTAKKPIVFTRVSSFLGFIEETTGIAVRDNPSED